MPVAQVLGRIDQLESTLGQINRTAPTSQAAMGQSSSATAPSAAGTTAASGTPDAGGDFAAMMRVLDYAENLNNPTARSTASTASSRSADSGSVSSAGSSPSSGSSSSVAPASGTSKTGADAVEIGKKYLGVPYVWGGNTAETGLDCSGLVKLVYGQMGIDLPRVAIDQAKQGREIPSLAEAEPGDLIVTDNGGHIGIYVGNGEMLNAPRPGRDVSIDKISYFGDVMTIRRLVDSPSEASAAASSSEAASSRRDFEARAGA